MGSSEQPPVNDSRSMRSCTERLIGQPAIKELSMVATTEYCFMDSESRKPPEAVVVGAMSLDILAMAETSADTDDSTPGTVRLVAGGVGRNIAEGLARLSVSCRLHSLIGQDLSGDQVLAFCRSAGLPTDRVVRDQKGSTAVYIAMNNNNGSLLHAVADMSLIERCRPEHFPHLQSDINHCDVCIVDANLPEAVIAWIVGHAAATPVVAEAVSVSKCQRLVRVLSRLDLLKVNLKEAATMARADTSHSPEQLAAMLLKTGLKSVLITLGAGGVLYASMEPGRFSSTRYPSTASIINSVNGAGDALLAGFIAARQYGADVHKQLAWGTEAARLSLLSQNACSELLTVERLRELSP